jgi:hypothetical protein
MLAQLGQQQSAGKTQMEASLKTRSDPVVRIDTTPQGPRATQIQNWVKVLPTSPLPVLVTRAPTVSVTSVTTNPTLGVATALSRTLATGTGTAAPSKTLTVSKQTPTAPSVLQLSVVTATPSEANLAPVPAATLRLHRRRL